jgi:Domain of unknown function (DUF5658)
MSRVLPGMFVASLVFFGLHTPAAAQEPVATDTISAALLFPTTPLVPSPPAAPVKVEAAEAALPAFVRNGVAKSLRRPTLLPALYVAQGALQAMDAHSTYAAINRGAHEANPVMKNVVGNRGAMLAMKAGVAASTIWMAESMWKRGNRIGAVMTMIAANSVTGFVVAHNYRLARQLR